MTTTSSLHRRRDCHRWLAAASLGALLAPMGGCASASAAGMTGMSAMNALRGLTLSPQQLNALLARQFPYTRSFSGLADLTLQSPSLSLLPASNRLATAFGLVVTERLMGTRYSGGMDLDYGLRFDATQGAIRMADARVNRLSIDQLPRAQQQLVSQWAPMVAEHLLADMVIYRFAPAQLELARNLGWVVNALRVQPDGLHIAMGPQGAR
ncbi:MAG: hypothetical protein Q4F13_02030 [Pseudomonadota bacterium]|nr:hypothetical protein [Pseudomonadota bacterium]